MIFEKLIEKIYKGNTFVRNDPDGTAYYFSPADFDGLKYEPYAFTSFTGNALRGYFYYYGEKSDDRLIVFDHGMGNGHRAYMKEIELIARRGYTVFSYDHTGCVESEGENTNGLTQSLADLDACISTLKKCRGYTNISVIGHSWGGFSTMNIAALHPEITHIVGIAGFVSVKRMIKQSFNGIIRGYAKPVYELERFANPDYVKYDAAETLKNSSVKALLIYSDNDPIVNVEHHYRVLEKELADCKNITLMLCHNKRHNPHYTEKAVAYKDLFFKDLTKRRKSKALLTDESKKAFVSSYDFDKMTEQDENVWAKIFEHLES